MADETGNSHEKSDHDEAFLPLETIEDVTQRLQPFLKANPYSSVSAMEFEKEDSGKVTLNTIKHPWNDPTLQVLIAGLDPPLLTALNSVVLPERLSAIWHIESGDLEVLWTAYPLSEDQLEVIGRCFSFRYGGRKYQCEFGASSAKLLTIASNTVPTTNPSDTNFRNILSFFRFATQSDKESVSFIDKPLSFWIRKTRLDKRLIPMLECLNFYMSYYDVRSPRILIHDIHDPIKRRVRYVDDSFPKEILGRELDENLMSFWDAAHQPNQMLRFIFYYRIIEYVASHYVDSSVRLKIRRALANPALTKDIDRSIIEIVSAFDGTRADEVPRFNSLLSNCVKPDVIWKEIERNKDMFIDSVKFDGGFTLAPIINKAETASTFSGGGIIKFADAIRKIRNVLVHGRDQNTATAITPTPRNMKHLSAWVNAIAAAAGEVVLYGNDS